MLQKVEVKIALIRRVTKQVWPKSTVVKQLGQTLGLKPILMSRYNVTNQYTRCKHWLKVKRWLPRCYC